MINGIFENIGSLNLFSQFSSNRATGCLEIFTNDVSWLFYFDSGEIFFASNSILSLDRFNRHLRHFGLRKVDPTILTVDSHLLLNHLDYSTTCSILNKQQVSPDESAKVIDSLVKDIVELFSWVRKGSYSFYDTKYDLPIFISFDIKVLTTYCNKRLENWQNHCPLVRSPYQKPFLMTGSLNNISGSVRESDAMLIRRIEPLLSKDLSFRELATRINKDEFDLVKTLYPALDNYSLSLKDPEPPFDRLPMIPEKTSKVLQKKNSKTLVILAVDDNVSMLDIIEGMLKKNMREDFEFIGKTNSIDALMDVTTMTPDLILLDIEMEGLNGHKLCNLFRKRKALKHVPIIMVTAKKGLLDRTASLIEGATAYLTKPFGEDALMEVIYKTLYK